MSDSPELGRLVEADLRDAWSHEAHGFTPWLAEHLDQLGEVIGIPLEHEGSEVAVDRFHADMLARNPHDDSRVLIENQLEAADHGHLGQIMTYLAGLDAHIVIWVAREFDEAHLSALNWLNEHTVEPFAFFAVRVKVVRIGESPLAPVFEVLSRPNEWERRLQAVAKETRSGRELAPMRRALWTRFYERHSDAGGSGRPSGSSSEWWDVGETGLVVSTYIAQNGVGVFVRGQRGVPVSEVYDLLAPYESALAERLEIEFGPRDGVTSPFSKSRRGSPYDPELQDQQIDWLYETASKYVAVLNEAIGTDDLAVS